MKFRTIVADPPWSFESGCWDRPISKISNKSSGHYDAMETNDICAINVPSADDAYLFLWTTSRHLIEGDASHVARAWGFDPLTTIVWCKPQMGLGYYVRNSHELLIFGRKGSPGQFKRKDFMSWFIADRKKHSQKPSEFQDWVEELCDGPYLELFARSSRPGWTTLGLELGDRL